MSGVGPLNVGLVDRKLLTKDLKEQMLAAGTMTALEAMYLPFCPEPRARTMIAREKKLDLWRGTCRLLSFIVYLDGEIKEGMMS